MDVLCSIPRLLTALPLLTDATYVHELSTFDETTYGHNRLAIEKLNASIHYIQQYYLGHLTTLGHNVLFSIPIFKSAKVPSFGLTTVAFHTYSKEVVERRTLRRLARTVQSPVIVILGMTESRPLPSYRLPYSTSWLIQDSRSLSIGSVTLSQKVFLAKRLLPLLAKVNAATTIVPIWLDVEGGEWKLDLTTWDGEKSKKRRETTWTPVAATSSAALEYKWDHHDEWTYKGHHISDSTHEEYKVSCESLSVQLVHSVHPLTRTVQQSKPPTTSRSPLFSPAAGWTSPSMDRPRWR